MATALAAFERLPKNTRRTLWAEDGALFLTEALRGNHRVLEPYGGYLHVIPRATAIFVVELLDVKVYALAINLSACLFTGLVAAVVYVSSEDAVPNRPLRVWLASATVLLPMLGVEVLANLANLHSMFMWGAFWGFLRTPRTWRGAAALSLFELLATLSEIQTALLALLVPLVIWRHRNLRHCLVIAGWTVGVACQTYAALTHETGRHPHLLEPLLITQLLGLEVAMPLWSLDTFYVRELIESYGWWIVGLAALPMLLGIAICLRYGNATQRFTVLAACAVALVAFCVSHMMNEAVPGGPGYSALKQAPVIIRYSVVPALLLLSTVAVGTAAGLRNARGASRWLGVASVVALLLTSANHFRSWSLRDPATSWTKQMRDARVKCTGDTPPSEYTFAISPDPWQVNVDCSRLR